VLEEQNFFNLQFFASSALSSSILKREIPPSCDLDSLREGNYEVLWFDDSEFPTVAFLLNFPDELP
jgi:hypothetical protein